MLPKNAVFMDDDLERVSAMLCGDCVKLVAEFSMAYFDAVLHVGDAQFSDAFNDHEPYDRLTHVFYVPQTLLHAGDAAVMTALDSEDDGDLCACTVRCPETFADPDTLRKAYDSGIVPYDTGTETLSDGLLFHRMHCRDKDGAPVEVAVLEIDPRYCTLYVGTPDDGYADRDVRASIPDMIAAAEQNGQDVLAAVNADFFEIFANGRPSGLCVKNGRVVANADSMRPFIGILRDGSAVITDLRERPDIVPQLWQAAAGLPRILRNGEVCDWMPLEPFSAVRHPRTAAGVCADGRILLLEADGRIPTHSNGATLIDLAILLRSFGAVDALNLDGGGSSAVYTRSDDGFSLRTVPADLFRPNDCLIREDFNSLLVARKK